MFDSTAYFSTYLALISAFLTMEIFNFGLNLCRGRKQEQEQRKFEQKLTQAVLEGRVVPTPFPGSMPGRMPMPCSGEEDVESQTGQYL